MFFFIICIVALLYMTWDVNYFFNVAFTIGYGRLFDKKKKLNEATTIYGKNFLQYTLDIFKVWKQKILMQQKRIYFMFFF